MQNYECNAVIQTQLDVLYVKCLNLNSEIPTRSTNGSVGYDLTSCEDTVVESKSFKLIKTGLAIKCPQGTYGRIAPRSGLASKYFIDVGAGVIDNDYRGEVKVLLFNHHPTNDFHIKIGDRIAQLILEKCLVCPVIKVNELDETERNEKGFGSSGL